MLRLPPEEYVHTYLFFNDAATTEIYTLSLHDALPICGRDFRANRAAGKPRSKSKLDAGPRRDGIRPAGGKDRKSTRLNSSHSQISYAVFCLKKKKKHPTETDASRSRSSSVSVPIKHTL